MNYAYVLRAAPFLQMKLTLHDNFWFPMLYSYIIYFEPFSEL
jgi:hypothetical protein